MEKTEKFVEKLMDSELTFYQLNRLMDKFPEIADLYWRMGIFKEKNNDP